MKSLFRYITGLKNKENTTMSEENKQEEFTFDYEPIRGYPELKWAGKRPFKGVPYYPAQLKESYDNTPPVYLAR